MATPAVPVIPGMWYDAVRRRYYRATQDNPSPPSAPAGRPPSDSTPPLSPHKMIRLIETGLPASSPTAIPAALLARTKPLACSSHPSTIGRPSLVERSDALITGPPLVIGPLRYTTALARFPNAECLDCVCLHGKPIPGAADYCPRSGVLATAMHSCLGPGYATSLVRLGGVRDGPVQENLVLPLSKAPTRVALQVGGKLCAIASERQTVIVGISSEGAAYNLPTFMHPDRSAGLATVFCNGGILTGTRAGNLYRYDWRVRGERPVWKMCLSGEGCSVVDLKLGVREGQVYASCMRNGKDNLALWDLRMSTNFGAVVRFKDHVNSHKPLRFDVKEFTGGGLVMAGGDDGVVRMWDASLGGSAVGSIGFGAELPQLVKLAGWGESNNGGPAEAFGAWVVTDRVTYALDIGARRRMERPR